VTRLNSPRAFGRTADARRGLRRTGGDMSYKWFFLFALLLVPARAAQAQPATVKGPDYSLQGGPYAVLNNLLFESATRVEHVGDDPMVAYGFKLDGAQFVVESQVMVTDPNWFPTGTGCDPTSPSEPPKNTEQAEFEVSIGFDRNDEVHDEMLRRIYWYWLSNKPSRWRPVDFDEHLTYKDGKYLMFLAAYDRIRWGRVRTLVWVDGKVVRFRFKRFLNMGKGFWARTPPNPGEALDDFVARTGVRSGGVKLHLRWMGASFRKEFLKQYEKGAFGGSL
jgi:hypothetical protein